MNFTVDLETLSDIPAYAIPAKQAKTPKKKKAAKKKNMNASQATILRDFELHRAWIKADLIRTGFNSRKTTRKGVQRLKSTIRSQGFLASNAVVVYPSSSADDYTFQCADGMHRIRCVVELSEEKKASGDSSGINCGDEVYAIILRPDIPRHLILQLSVCK